MNEDGSGTEYHRERTDADRAAPTAIDRISSHALKAIEAPGHPSEGRDAEPNPIPGGVTFARVRKEVESGLIQVPDPIEIFDPPTSIRLLSQTHMDYFGEDFWAAEDQFIKVRYHVGKRGDVYEFYSDAFPLGTDSWSEMEKPIADHIREHLGPLGPEVAENVLVKLVYFHDNRIVAKQTKPGTLAWPMDFATAMTFTVKEFVNFVSYGARPNALRLHFDASYLWLGLNTELAFHYIRHWEFFGELVASFGELIGRPFPAEDLALNILMEHRKGNVASLVSSIGMQEKRTYEEKERIYRPRVSVTIDARRLVIELEDKTGVLRGFVGEFDLRDYKREEHGDTTVLTRVYKPGVRPRE